MKELYRKVYNDCFNFIDCTDNHNIEPTTGLSDLIEGAAHCYLGSPNLAAQSYRNCLQTRIPENDFQDQHVSAFALYELGSILSNGNLKVCAWKIIRI